MQAEAEDEGLLNIWIEFTPWYPWIGLHIKLNLNPALELIFIPLALDANFKIYNEQYFGQLLEDAFDVGYDVVCSIIIESIASGIAARILGRSSIPSLFLAIGINFGVQLSLAYLSNAYLNLQYMAHITCRFANFSGRFSVCWNTRRDSSEVDDIGSKKNYWDN